MYCYTIIAVWSDTYVAAAMLRKQTITEYIIPMRDPTQCTMALGTIHIRTYITVAPLFEKKSHVHTYPRSTIGVICPFKAVNAVVAIYILCTCFMKKNPVTSVHTKHRADTETEA